MAEEKRTKQEQRALKRAVAALRAELSNATAAAQRAAADADQAKKQLRAARRIHDKSVGKSSESARAVEKTASELFAVKSVLKQRVEALKQLESSAAKRETAHAEVVRELRVKLETSQNRIQEQRRARDHDAQAADAELSKAKTAFMAADGRLRSLNGTLTQMRQKIASTSDAHANASAALSEEQAKRARLESLHAEQHAVVAEAAILGSISKVSKAKIGQKKAHIMEIQV